MYNLTFYVRLSKITQLKFSFPFGCFNNCNLPAVIERFFELQEMSSTLSIQKGDIDKLQSDLQLAKEEKDEFQELFQITDKERDVNN